MVFYVQQQAIYICVFSAFLAADAIHNERKSRRILLVLSKAISRGEYLLAVILGTCAMAVAYALLFGLCGVWLTARAALPSGQLWSMVTAGDGGLRDRCDSGHVFLDFPESICGDGSDFGLFCAPGDAHAQRHAWSIWLPGLPILLELLRFNFRSEWAVNWMASGDRDSGSRRFFWVLAAAVFNRRDIAVPVE